MHVLEVKDREFGDSYFTLIFKDFGSLMKAKRLIEDFDYNWYEQDEHEEEYIEALVSLLMCNYSDIFPKSIHEINIR